MHVHVRVHGFSKAYVPTTSQVVDIMLCRNRRLGDMTVFDMFMGAFTKSNTANICGIRFTAGEPPEGSVRAGWDSKRCGSVFTAVVDGVSR